MVSKLWVLDLDDTLAYTTRDMQGDPTRVTHLQAVGGVYEFLDKTQARGDRRVLVTVGEWPLQMAKIQLLELKVDRSSILSPAKLPEEPQLWLEEKPIEKSEIFKRLVEESNGTRKVLVGDRLDRDICVGNRLGFTTVRVRLPEGKYSRVEPQSLEEVPDYTVEDFFELMQLPIFTET